MCSCKNNHSLNAWGVATSNFQKSCVSLGGGNNLQITKKKIHYQKNTFLIEQSFLKCWRQPFFQSGCFFRKHRIAIFKCRKTKNKFHHTFQYPGYFCFQSKRNIVTNIFKLCLKDKMPDFFSPKDWNVWESHFKIVTQCFNIR